MKMSMAEALHVLRVHQLMDEQLPALNILESFFSQFEFSDHGARHLEELERKLWNRGANMWWRIQERVKMGLPLDDIEQEFTQENGARINYVPESFILC